MKETLVSRLIHTIDTVPPMPLVVESMLNVANDPGSSAADLASIISEDTGLTAKVLGLVNSSFYGFARQVTTVTESVILLGFETIVNLVIGMSVAKTMEAGESHVLDRQRFWQHSLGAAASARILSNMVDYPNPEEAFIAGMMHDVGKLFFDEYLPDEYATVVSCLHAGERRELLAERDILGADHTVAGGMLFRKWRLPRLYQMAARHHHAPLRFEPRLGSQTGRLVGVVYLADIFSKMHGDACDAQAYLPAIDPHVWELLGLTEEQARRVFLLFDEEIQRAREFFGIACSDDLGDIVLLGEDELMRVMIACRERPLISPVKIILSAAGFDVSYGILTDKGIEIPEGLEPDIILLDEDDVSSEFGHVIHLVEQARNKTNLRVIILHSSPISSEEEKRHEQQGVFILHKPFRSADLVEKLRAILALSAPSGSTARGSDAEEESA